MDKKKILAEVGFLIVVIILTVYNLFKDAGLNDFARIIRTARPGLIGLTLVLLLAYILLESVIIRLMMHSLGEDVPMAACCKYSFIGFFFYCISPAGSLEQPMQLYVMHRDGVSASKSVFSLAIITITFKLALVMLGVGVYFAGSEQVIGAAGSFSGLCILGFVLSCIMIAGIIGALFIPDTVTGAAERLLEFLVKLRLIRNAGRWEQKIAAFNSKYKETLGISGRHPLMLAGVLLITLVQKVCFLAITAVSCLSLGITHVGVVDITAIQELIQLATEMLPLPGGLGVNELLYLRAFEPMMGGDTLSTLIVSRGVGYYCQLIICGIMSAIYYINARFKEKRGRK